MTDRLNSQFPATRAERLRQGPPMKDLHRYTLGRLARSEARIIGSARRARIRDYSIGALRAVTLVGAVLIPTLKPDPNTPVPPPGPSPVSLTVQSTPSPMTRSPTEVNLDMNVSGGQADGQPSARVEIHGHRPVFVRNSSKPWLWVWPSSMNTGIAPNSA